MTTKPVLFCYSSGAPNHRVNYISALFCKLDFEYLSVMRSTPYYSYRNPVERIMSIFSLGLQGSERNATRFEVEAKKYNSMKATQAATS